VENARLVEVREGGHVLEGGGRGGKRRERERERERGKRFEVEEEASENEKRKSISSSFPAAACLGLICALALAESFYGAALARARTTSEST
jgi:hypothetical protein